MRRAFTLIELLVVIAIIAILAAILFPVFVQAKESAKQTQCMMQMKQTGLGLIMYAGDHDDTWCPMANATTVAPGRPQQPWIGYDTRNAGLIGGFYGDMTLPARNAPVEGKIDPYLKNNSVKRCPKTPDGWQLAVAYNLWPRCKVPYQCAYSNYWTSNPKAEFNEYGPGAVDYESPRGFVETRGVNDSEIQESANTIALWEHGAWVPGCNFLFGPNWYDSPPDSENFLNHFHFLHRQGAVTVWCDGHVKRMSYGQLRRPMFSVRKDIYQ
ncbi:MAG: prepilin-type N-terminal cleavage/methylation domain-containing protein [Armatimonadetes bacterium]|nr:prepilin-type N-terminal cleavage/methylation domain-containing protein [Armatimonadota bacterium]